MAAYVQECVSTIIGLKAPHRDDIDQQTFFLLLHHSELHSSPKMMTNLSSVSQLNKVLILILFIYICNNQKKWSKFFTL